MELIKSFIDLFIHLDHHVAELAAGHGTWIYAILFAIIFAETGFVVTPFLPGDSLLFVLGALAARDSLSLGALWVLLAIAAVAGDAINYWIGKKLALKVLNNEKIPFLKQEYLDRTAAFFEKYGKKTIILARFVPIVRTFAPFLAGVGKMKYAVFASYNVIGGLVWVTAGLGSGFLFGNIPFVAKNFSMVVLGIVVLSLVPAVLEFLKHRQPSGNIDKTYRG
ncbi:MAG: DedA family protein [Candidatus Omnitrophica bacterium]|nr:DedA family protein [Candidatus Omnitrophota bacterium]